MKSRLPLLLLIGFLALNLHATITTNVAGPYQVGQSIGFDVTCHDGTARSSCIWFWGDGSRSAAGPDTEQGWIYHTYTQPGTYRVEYYRSFWAAAASVPKCSSVSPYSEYFNITVEDNRYIVASVSAPVVGQPVTFTAFNFNTPNSILWDFGDGVRVTTTSVASHTFTAIGTYFVQAYDWSGDTNTPIVLSVTVGLPPRQIVTFPTTPRVDMAVRFTAQNFQSKTINWNFGDGSSMAAAPATVSHRYQTAGSFVVSAVEAGQTTPVPVSLTLVILPENRSLKPASSQIMPGEKITFQAVNFRNRLVLWNFGDGSAPVSGPRIITHTYARAGRFTALARDENGESAKAFSAVVKVLGITDQVTLLLAELTLDNGKQYKVVPRNGKEIKGVLRMKMRGTGIVAGNWLVDDRPFEFFNQVAYQGEIKTITTNAIPGLPTNEPGLHTLSVRLSRPSGADAAVEFPVLRYFVLAQENIITLSTPVDGGIAKENEIPEFSWEAAKGASKYQIAFANSLLSMLEGTPQLTWIDTLNLTRYTPSAEVWNGIERNRWSYWKVRALDGLGNTVAESQTRDLKVIVPEASLSLLSVTDLQGRPLSQGGQNAIASSGAVLIHGQIEYAADAEFLVIRVFRNGVLSDQLLFRDLRKGEKRSFETSIIPDEAVNQIDFQVVKSSSPAVIIGTMQVQVEKRD